jgi:phosphate starvation-inducible PhoH-like protein
MTESSIAFASQDHYDALCGPNNRHLKRLRQAIDLRWSEQREIPQLVVSGEEDKVRLAEGVLVKLRTIIERKGGLNESDFLYELDSAVAGSSFATLSHGANGHGQGHGHPADDGGMPVAIKTKVVPRTPAQKAYWDMLLAKELVFCAGPAGCGKTYLAVAMGVELLLGGKVDRIVLARPAIEAGERLGFLPGALEEKVDPYMRPLEDALSELLPGGTEEVKRRKSDKRKSVEIVPLAYMRGRTLKKTFIILDEGQNTTVTQMKMFLTRMGKESRVVVTGDPEQIDLPPGMTSGFRDALARLASIEGIGVARLTTEDIQRHRLVREIVTAYEGRNA